MTSHSVTFHSGEAILTIAMSVGFCMVGWVVSIPAVLLIRNVRGWRFWPWWIFGSCSGPALMVALIAVVYFVLPSENRNGPWFRPELRPLIFLAGAISCLASLFYLLLLRRTPKKAKADPPASTVS